MGEVYVRVRLSNGGDMALVQRGLASLEDVRYCDVDALVDTGATRSVIPTEIAERLGLAPIAQVIGKLANGENATAALCGPIDFQIMGRATFDDAYIMGDEVLIGQVVLEKTDFLVDCTNRTLVPRHAEGQINRL